MYITDKEPQWFFSPEAEQIFSQAPLEERTLLLYSFLHKTAGKDIKKETLVQISFFFADALYESDLPYHGYPELIDKTKNPYLAYIMGLSCDIESAVLFAAFLSILHGISNPLNSNDWIFSDGAQKADSLDELCKQHGKEFLEMNPLFPVKPYDYIEIDASLIGIELKIAWLFNAPTGWSTER